MIFDNLQSDTVHNALRKKYFKIDQQIARHFGLAIKVFQTPLPFYANN